MTIAGILDEPALYAAWALAIMIQFVTPSIAARVAPRFDIQPAHFVERHGLLLIVVLGESVVAIGIGIGDVSLNFRSDNGLPGYANALAQVSRASPQRSAG